MSKIIKKILIALDFDHTIINGNLYSDSFLYQLAPNKNIPDEIDSLSISSRTWIQYLNELFKYLHDNNVTSENIMSCIEKIPLTDGMKELLTCLPQEETDYAIISDSNTIFINHILQKNELCQNVKSIFANPAKIGQDSCIKVEQYHKQDTCSISTANLCKGDVLSKLVESTDGVEYVRIAYIGDGLNDFCPSLRLKEHDAVFPRVDHTLLKTIPVMEKERNLKIKAQVFPWNSGLEILNMLKPWYKDLHTIVTPKPRLFDPGVI